MDNELKTTIMALCNDNTVHTHYHNDYTTYEILKGTMTIELSVSMKTDVRLKLDINTCNNKEPGCPREHIYHNETCIRAEEMAITGIGVPVLTSKQNAMLEIYKTMKNKVQRQESLALEYPQAKNAINAINAVLRDPNIR